MQTQEEYNQTQIPRTPFAFVRRVSKPHKWFAGVALVAVFLAQTAELISVYVISKLIDNFSLEVTKEAQIDTLIYWGTIFVLLGILDRIFWRISGFSGINWAIKANKTSYDTLYSYISSHSHSYFTNRFAGALSNKVSNASNGVGDITTRFLWSAWPEIISLFVTIWLFFTVHWSVGLATIVIFSAVLMFNIWFVKKRRPFVVEYSKSASFLRGVGVDLLNNISATRQYTRRMDELRNIESSTADMAQKDKKQSYMGEWLMVCNGLFSIVLIVIVLSIVYTMLKAELATAGELVLVLILLSRISFTFNSIGNMLNALIRKHGEIEEGLQEILIEHEIVDVPNAKTLHSENPEINWNQVCFEYEGIKVFKDFDLVIPAGQRLGLVGQSGAGKSTFVSLLLRQHDISAGSIAIDGQDISQVTQDSLRQAIAVVPQEPALFHRSIKDNILYGNPNATEAEVVEVAKKAQAHDFISELPEGYDTLVGERGVKLSGGQKQRVAIARAMMKDAPILVLDEATSALDSESEVAIQTALETLMEGRTVIAVAHRLSTLRKMDRIIVMENGRIIEDGNHDSLATSGGVYERLWNHQAGGFMPDPK